MTLRPDLFALSILVLGVLFLTTSVCASTRGRARAFVYGVLLLLAGRYLYWRFSATLPEFAWRLPALYAWGFALLEAASHAGAFLTYAILLKSSDRSEEADKLEASLRRDGKPPSVDVLIPTYNEEFSVLERTLVCALGLDYPRKTIYVLDDSRRDWLKDYCAKKGLEYVTRPDNAHAKAGNLNNGLAVSKQRSNGDLILVLDADFAPRRDFLWRTAGFFKEPRVGIVQTPQTFFNPDPIQWGYRAIGSMPDEQRLLFNVLQPAKDAWGVATCCGTSSLTRRACLEAIGGVPTDSVTEDLLLSHRLAELGYETRYLNESLSVGLAPEGIREYLSQRARWCLGALQIAFLHTGPLGRNGLKPRHRLEYLSTLLYWCASLPFLLAGIVVPIVFGWTGLSVIDSNLEDYLSFFLPFFVGQLVAVRWLTGLPQIPILHDAPNLLVSLKTTPLVLKALIRPFGRRFEVTAKGGDHTQRRINWRILLPPVVLLFALLASLALTTDTDIRLLYGGQGQRSMIVNLLWGAHAALILCVAALLAVERPRPRKLERFLLDETAGLRIGNAPTLSCRIDNLSEGGARIFLESGTVPDIGETLTLEVDGAGSLKGEVLEIKPLKSGGDAVPVSRAERKRRSNSAEVRPMRLRVKFAILDAPQRESLIRKLYGGEDATESMVPLADASSLKTIGGVLYRIAG